MPNQVKIDFIKELSERFGNVRKLPGSLSLYEIGDGACRVYIRYSKIHGRNQSFYGIRKEDLLQLDGFNAVICFLWNDQDEPLFIPYGDFEEVFASVQPASDGQYKAQIYHGGDGLEFYVAQVGFVHRANWRERLRGGAGDNARSCAGYRGAIEKGRKCPSRTTRLILGGYDASAAGALDIGSA